MKIKTLALVAAGVMSLGAAQAQLVLSQPLLLILQKESFGILSGVVRTALSVISLKSLAMKKVLAKTSPAS